MIRTKAPIITAGRCPACLAAGRTGATCCPCLLRAYQLRINITRTGERDAIRTHGEACDLVRLLRAVRSDLLAGLVGSELIAEVLPGARFEAPGERP